MAEQVDQVSEGRGRALIPLFGPAAPQAERPMAGFLTQLIACDRRLPAYRQARRAEPGMAAARYSSTPFRHAARFDSNA